MRHFVHRRRLATAVAAVVVVTGVGLGVAPASAAPASATSTTVRSPVKWFSRASTDIMSTTVTYERAKGVLSATVVLRGTITPGRGGGPNYSVYLYGPQRTIGGPGQGSVALSAFGFAARGELRVQPAGTGASIAVPVRARYVGNRVEFRATDRRLTNLPLRYLQVQSSLYRSVSPTDYFSTDGVYGQRLR